MRKLTTILLAAVFFTIPCAAASRSVSYLYGGTSPVYANNIARTRGNLNMVIADYFHIASDGSAALTKTPDRAFIQERRKEGIRVTAFVSNHWDRDAARKAMSKRASVAAALAEWVRQYELDGLDVDIENLNAADRDNFTDFIRILRGLLPRDKHLSAAVAANPYRLTAGWHGQYDYAAIGQYCDSVLLMTYDQSYEGSAAGPVASYDFTEASVKEALRHIPKEKLMMGVPFYGRYWAALNGGGTVSGKAFTVADIDVITAQYRSQTWYDELNCCARATVTVKNNDPALGLWGGKKLTPGIYDIWYENERSLSKRMELCRKYGLAGVGSWALGQEPERFWTSYRLWLNGIPFTDIAGQWYEQAVCGLYELGIVAGTGGGLFSPGKALSRAEAVVLMCKLLDIPPIDPSGAPHEIRGHWGAAYLWTAARCGLFEGDGVSYRPEGLITRAELTVLCLKCLSLPNTVDYSQRFFDDVAPGMWFNNAVVTMRVFGLVGGAPDGLFHPEKGAGRAEAAQLVWKMLDAERKVYVTETAARSVRPNGEGYMYPKEPPVLEPR